MLVEEFRASDKEGTVAKYLSEERDPCSLRRLRAPTARGRDYMPLDFGWR